MSEQITIVPDTDVENHQSADRIPDALNGSLPVVHNEDLYGPSDEAFATGRNARVKHIMRQIAANGLSSLVLPVNQ